MRRHHGGQGSLRQHPSVPAGTGSLHGVHKRNLHREGCWHLPVLLRLPQVKGNVRISDRSPQRGLHRIDKRQYSSFFFLISFLGYCEFSDHEVMSRTENNTVNYEITGLFRDERQSVDLPWSKSYASIEVMIDGESMSLDLVHVTDNNIHGLSFVDMDLRPWIGRCPMS